VALVAGAVAATVFALAAPAAAGVETLTGTTTCSNTDHVAQWSLSNGAVGGNMLIGTVTEQIGSDFYPVTGFSATVPSNGTTSGTSVVPGSETSVNGPLTLTVNVSWPDDNFSTLVFGSIDLGQACPGSTTTTSQPTTTPTTTTSVSEPTTTTQSPTTTTTTPTSARKPPTRTTQPPTRAAKAATRASAKVKAATAALTTTATQTTTTVIQQADPSPTSTTKPGAFTSTLAFTGSGTTLVVVFGLCFLTIGGSVLMHKRNALAGLRGHETNEELHRQRDRKKRSLWVYLPPR